MLPSEWGPTGPVVVAMCAALVTGLFTGFLLPFTGDRLKEWRARNFRWDVAQFELTKEFVANSRRLKHYCERYRTAKDKMAAKTTIDELHGAVRANVQQLRILADSDCNKHAQLMQRHLYAIYRIEVRGDIDRRAAEYPGETPEQRYDSALRAFVAAARKQLRVKGSAPVLLATPAEEDPWNEEPDPFHSPR